MGFLPLALLGGGALLLAASSGTKRRRKNPPRRSNPKCYLCGKRIGYTGKWYCKKCEAKAKKARG